MSLPNIITLGLVEPLHPTPIRRQSECLSSKLYFNFKDLNEETQKTDSTFDDIPEPPHPSPIRRLSDCSSSRLCFNFEDLNEETKKRRRQDIYHTFDDTSRL